MGSNVSTNGCGPTLGNLVEFVGLEGDVDEHMKQASVKRKRRHEKRHQKRHKRDAHNQRRRQRQRRALRYAKGNSGSSARNIGKENAEDTMQDSKKMKSRHKSTESEIEARIIDTIQQSILDNKETRKEKDFKEKNNDKLKENRQRKQDPKLYDLAGDDLTKIYDLRTVYNTVAHGGERKARDLHGRDECHAGSNATDGFQDTGFQFFTQARNGPCLRRSFSMSRSKTVDLTDHSQKENRDQKGLLKRSNSQYSSFRDNAISPKRSTFARFSLRFPGMRSFKQEISKSLPLNRQNGKDSSSRIPNHLPKRIDSYLDQSFLQSDVSFHMQGPTKPSHILLASASAVSPSDKGRNFRSLADPGNSNKENELLDKTDSRKELRPFGFGRLGSRLQNRTLKLANGRMTAPCDTIEEESEYSLHEAKPTIFGKRQIPNRVSDSANSEMCSSGVTPVYLAAQEGHLQVLQELVAAGGRMDHPAADGLTPVHAAAQMGCTEVLQYMVSMDPRLVHIRDADGATPLHFSASRGHLSAARLLLNSGASPDHADLWGKTPVHDALENRHQEMVRLLMQHSDVPAASSTDGDSKGRHSSGSNSSSSGSSKKGSSGRNSNTNTRRRQSSRQPSSSSQSPFYLHPPDDASSPKTSPPSPCSHHALQEELPPTRNILFSGEDEDREDHTLEGSEMTTSTNATATNRSGVETSSHSSHSKTNGMHDTFNTSKSNGLQDTLNGHSRSNSNHSSSSMRSNSRNSDESSHSHSGDSINSAGAASNHSSSSSSMLQELRETATQQQQLQSSSAGSEPEPFFLHDSEASSGNASPLQKLFTRSDSRNSRSGSERRSSVKSNRSGEGVPPPDYETESSSPSPTPSPAPRTHHSPLARVRSEPAPRTTAAPPTVEAPPSPHHSLPHQPTSPPASSVGGYVPPPPPPPPAPLIVPEKNNVLETEEVSSPTAKSFQLSSSEGDGFSQDSEREGRTPSTLTKEQSAATDGEAGEATEGGSSGAAGAGNPLGSAASRGLASISIAQLQSVQLRKTTPRDHSKSHSVPLPLEVVEKPDKSEVIAELKRSVDVGSPSKLKHQQQQQQQQQVQENLQVQITPEQIMSKVPQVDASGLPIPEWKRQMLARRAAERATAEEQQNRLHQLEMKRLQQLPPWKRQLLEKRSGGSSTPPALYMPRVVEPRKISVALTASR